MSKVIAVIPARGGSKRLKGKNKKDLCGKPLICWTIEVALECKFIDEIIVSTDDTDIIKIAQKYSKVRIHLRPDYLSQDDSTAEDVALAVLSSYDDDTIVIWLQPTSPLRTMEDIKSCYNTFEDVPYFPVISCYFEGKILTLNGAVYITTLSKLREHGFFKDFMLMYCMPKERSIDIDTINEFKACKRYLKNV